MEFDQGTRHLDRDLKLAPQVCRLFASMLSAVESLQVEDGQILSGEYTVAPTARCGMTYFSTPFRVARRFVGALDRRLQPDNEG